MVSDNGFTLVEVMVVAAITVLITGFLIANFSRARVDLNQTALTVQDTIRQAQSLALSGAVTQGSYRCGYGVHFELTSYVIFAGPDSSSVDCSITSRTFSTGTDTIIQQGLLPSNVLEFVLPIPDIFFVPPDPTTYIGGSNAAGVSATISIHRQGAACPSADCRSIYVSTSGRIQTQ